MAKIMVTGGAGFVDGHNIAALLDRGNEVICLDNFDGYYSPERKRANVAPSGDISKAQWLLGYDPQTPFKEGLVRFVDWYRAEVAGR